MHQIKVPHVVCLSFYDERGDSTAAELGTDVPGPVAFEK